MMIDVGRIYAAADACRSPWVRAKIQMLRERYEEAGYEIVERPRRDAFPEELELGRLYSPPLLARRGGETVVVEILDPFVSPSDNVLERADEFARHTNWHFSLVTGDDVVPHDTPESRPKPPTWPELERSVDEMKQTLPGLPGWMQLQIAWAALEAVLRRIARDERIPVDMLPAPVLMWRLSMPRNALESLEFAYDVHRRVRHGYAAPGEEVETAVSTVLRWLPALFPAGVMERSPLE